MKLVALAFLAAITVGLSMEATSLVYAGATDRATCIDAMVSGQTCDRPGIGARFIINEFYKGE